MTIKDRGHQDIRALTAGPPQELSVLQWEALCLWNTHSVPRGVLRALHTLSQL